MTTHAPASALTIYLIESSGPLRARLAKIIVAVGGVELIGTARDITTAHPGLQALAPDVVMLGLEHGQRATRQWLSFMSELGAHCKLIVLTANVATPLRQAYLNAGASHVFDKTAELAELRKTLLRLHNDHATIAQQTSSAD